MFERFAQDARDTIVRARAETVRAGRPAIGTEQMLLGLLAQPGPAGQALTAAGVSAAGLRARLPDGGTDEAESLDADALASLGIDLDAVRRATDAAFGPGALDRAGQPGRGRHVGRLSMTAGARQALQTALQIAARRRDGHLNAGHVLLGIIDQEDSPAVAALVAAGADIDDLRADVLRRMTAAA